MKFIQYSGAIPIKENNKNEYLVIEVKKCGEFIESKLTMGKKNNVDLIVGGINTDNSACIN